MSQLASSRGVRERCGEEYEEDRRELRWGWDEERQTEPADGFRCGFFSSPGRATCGVGWGG